MPKTRASMLVIAATAITVATLFLLPFTPKKAVRTALVEPGDFIRSTLMEGIVGYEQEQPLVALRAGMIARVHVRQGQRVNVGDLLVSMDTSAQEEELAALTRLLHEQEKVLEAFGETDGAALLSAQGTLDARTRQAELRASIASGQIRAATDGVVGAIYAEEGDYTDDMTLLGVVHGTGLRVTAAGRAQELTGVAPGAAAMVSDGGGAAVGAAVLSRASAPEADGTTGQTIQPLTFQPVEGSGWNEARAGDRVTVEMVCETLHDRALVPISAVDADGRVWVVEEGAASPVEIDLSLRNDQYVALPPEWAGRRVVLLPDASSLYPGCPVKEAAAQ